MWPPPCAKGPNFAVDCAEDGLTGLHLAENRCYDLIILDLMLPGLDGPGLLRKVRARGDRTPVLILTAKGEASSIISAAQCRRRRLSQQAIRPGGIDCPGQSAHPPRQGSRRSPAPSVRSGGQHRRAECSAAPASLVDLSPTEYRILEYLIHRPRVIVSKRELLEHLYDYNWEHHSNVIEAHISNLRRKLEAATQQPSIETLRGRGYRLLWASRRP